MRERAKVFSDTIFVNIDRFFIERLLRGAKLEIKKNISPVDFLSKSHGYFYTSDNSKCGVYYLKRFLQPCVAVDVDFLWNLHENERYVQSRFFYIELFSWCCVV